MVNFIIQFVKYLMIIAAAVYTYFCFSVFSKKNTKNRRKEIYKKQTVILYLIQFAAYAAMFAATKDRQILILYAESLGLVTAVQIVYRVIYLNASVLLVNNMSLLLSTGLIMLTRLDMERAEKQLLIGAAALFITAFFPIIIRKMKKSFRKLKWLYAGAGILLLLVVLLAGSTSYGAKISLSVGGFSIQPSEFVKLLFVFFVAAMYNEATDRKQILITSAIAAVHVLILAASKDLGGALIFFIIYVFMIYVAVKKWYFLAGSAAAVALALFLGEKLFRHVQVRVLAWKDPLSVIDNEGYQISQSLFAIGTGGWFGTGLFKGNPSSIPVVVQDFVFSAISEEMGAVYGICIIMICISCLLMFFNIAMQMKDRFYKYVALGLGTAYGFQVFLTIGGAVKFIPSTGVTLPLVSYGGSSLLATFMMFAVIQSLYIIEGGTAQERLQVRDYDDREKDKKRKKQ